MDALLAALVLDFMPAEAVEDPTFAGCHVNGFTAAREQHARIGGNGNMYAKVSAPIIIDVDVLRHLRPSGEAHEAAASPHATYLSHDLLHIFAALEMLGRRHRTGDGVGRSPIRSDQPHSLVSDYVPRMRSPGRTRKSPDFSRQRFGVEAYRQFQERLFQTHSEFCPLLRLLAKALLPRKLKEKLRDWERSARAAGSNEALSRSNAT